MAAIEGSSFARELLEALGFEVEGKQIHSVRMILEVNDVARLNVDYFVTPEQAEKAKEICKKYVLMEVK